MKKLLFLFTSICILAATSCTNPGNSSNSNGPQLSSSQSGGNSSTFSVTYHSNGAIDPEDHIVMNTPAGKAVIKPYFYSKPAWKFESWNTKADGTGTDYKPYEEILLTENLELYAQYSYVKTIFQSSSQTFVNGETLVSKKILSGYSMPGKLHVSSYWTSDNSWDIILVKEDGSKMYLQDRIATNSGTYYNKTTTFENGIPAGYIIFSSNYPSFKPTSITIEYTPTQN
nr:InlB B-repeat-containing protein [uncultured Treponema sp.]